MLPFNNLFKIPVYLFLICFLVSSSIAQEQNKVSARKPSLGITPALVVAKIEAGKTFTQSFTLANSSDTYVRFRCSLGDYWYDTKYAPVMAQLGTQERTASPWIQFVPAEIIIPPQSSAVVKAIISVPNNAAGGYYAMPFFEGEAVEKPTDPNSTIEAKAISSIAISIGGLIVLSTEKNSNYDIEITKSKVLPPTDVSELELSLDFINRGNVHAFIKGVFAILNEKGDLVGQGKVEDRMILPGQHRSVFGHWSGTLPAGNYTILSTISYERVGQQPASLVDETVLKVD